jgi:hypothetical protein
LTEAELNRLGGAIRARALTIDCWSAAHGRLEWARAVRRLDQREYRAEQIAGLVRQRLARPA